MSPGIALGFFFLPGAKHVMHAITSPRDSVFDVWQTEKQECT